MSTPNFVIPELPISHYGTGELGNPPGVMAPLIFNAWYVIAPSADVDRTLRGIKVLGERLVYYRTEGGLPVVLDDRCAHRRFPLSKGRLKGDAIECGYHGFTYEPSGQCIWAPGIAVSEHGGKKLLFGVRAYPCAERGPWVWVWMGKPELADPAEIPLPDLRLEGHETLYGYKLNPANYMFLIENLLDLSHLHFLHEATDRAHASIVPSEAPAPQNGVSWIKVVERTEAGLVAAFCGDDPKRIVYFEDEVQQIGPSLFVGWQRREALPDDPLPPIKTGLFTIVHALTPVDERNTHQFYYFGFSSPLMIPKDKLIQMTNDVVFEQDAQAVAAMQATVSDDVRPGRVEFGMACDRSALQMRRILRDMKERELQTAQAG